MSKRISPKIISEIKQFRSQGWTLPELKRKFNVGYGSVHRHTKDVRIHPDFIELWQNKRNGSTGRMNKAVLHAKSRAVNEVTSLSTKEKLLIMSALYWAEGTKMDLSLTNSDPEMIKVFIKGMTNLLKVSIDKIRINIRIFEDMDKNRCINYWLKVTGLKPNQISSINILKGKKFGKLEFGIVRVRVLKGGDMLKYLKAVKNQIQAYY